MGPVRGKRTRRDDEEPYKEEPWSVGVRAWSFGQPRLKEEILV